MASATRRAEGRGRVAAGLLGLLEVPVPPHAILASALGSYAGQVVAGLAGWPLWAKVTATLLPWVPLFGKGVAHTGRTSGWLAFFTVLVVTQTGHLLEHVAQMVQIHALHLAGKQARGVFGVFDIEWVHFVWNAWVLVAVVLLLRQLSGNRWLWLALVVAGWHMVEHTYILSVYLSTGVPGTPGLLGAGGAIAGGGPLVRPDLHFLYNVVETLPLVAGFVFEARRTLIPVTTPPGPAAPG